VNQIIVLVREVPDEVANAWIADSPGTTAHAFYPVRDTVVAAGLPFHAGELILADDDGTVRYHRCVNLESSVVSIIGPEVAPDRKIDLTMLDAYSNGEIRGREIEACVRTLLTFRRICINRGARGSAEELCFEAARVVLLDMVADALDAKEKKEEKSGADPVKEAEKETDGAQENHGGGAS
jgi:hypothetical protein